MPFTRDAFLDVFAAYNEALWPFVLGLWLWTSVAFGSWMLGARWRESSLRLVLGVNWLWAGAAYHAAFFTHINPAAWLFAALFLFQAAVFLTRGRLPGPMAVPSASRRREALGFTLVAYGLAYPAIAWLDGFEYPFAPTFGVPCPTAILTTGFLVASSARSSVESLVPILWSMIGGSASWLFGVRADVVLPLAGFVLGIDLVRRPLIHKGAMP